ncbi:hypothetical protein GCM10010402_19880 [Actinomadura luteofluorescens]
MIVVGGGPAGLETARLAAGRGLKVRLLERESRLGGRFRLAAALHCNPGHHRVLDWYAGELERLGVEVRTGVAVDAAVLASLRPDAVVLATGRAPRLPEVEGAGPPNVTEIAEWLREGGEPPEQCTIWGADQAAMAVADHIAVHGGRVQIIAARETLAPEVGPRARMLPIARGGEPGGAHPAGTTRRARRNRSPGRARPCRPGGDRRSRPGSGLARAGSRPRTAEVAPGKHRDTLPPGR